MKKQIIEDGNVYEVRGVKLRKVVLNMKEEMKYKEIKKFVEKGGNKKAIALKLNITNRQVNRLIQKYIAEGKSAFSHKNKNKMPKIAFSMKQKEDIINLYINQYSDANITHFSEIVFQELNICITPQTINKWLKHKGILSPKARKVTKKMMKNILKKKQINDKNTKKENNSIDSPYTFLKDLIG